MTYKLNLENTGLETDAQVRRMAELMQADGHDVEYTGDIGAIQAIDENGDAITCPVSDQEWFRYLDAACE